LPGLVLAVHWAASHWTLLDAGQRRTAFLRTAIDGLGLAGRVEVLTARAETVGREAAQRGAYDLVVARSFGSPAATAECAAPLLQVGGLLVVSEPPEPAPDRWPVGALAELGLAPSGVVAGPPRLQILEQQTACPGRYPRRTGVPGKRPLW
jgi:16S rRNA (guanine527-N7)-methyltransferase